MTSLTQPACSDRLSALIAAGAARARESGRPVVVSVVDRAGDVDPLDALAGWEFSRGTAAGTRMFWSRPRAGIASACVGQVSEVAAAGPERFSTLRSMAAELLDDAVVGGIPVRADGVGPAFTGGLSFDPGGSHSEAWRNFPAARFILPRVQLTAVGDDRWVTLSMLVNADGAADMDPAEVERMAEQLCTPARRPARAVPSVTFTDSLPAAEWRSLVADAVGAIDGGEFEKVVLARSRRCNASAPIDVHAVLRRLAAGYPDCFVYGVWHGDSAFVGASPERLVRLDGRAVQASSLAGSAPRGASVEDDRANAALLAASEKDRGEHALVREALVAGLDRLCDGVTAADVPSLFTLPHVHHLHTAVTGTLRARHTIIDLVEALHPTPAVGGAPREAALAWIRANERLDRGWYAAPVGWFARDRGEFAVALRSALIRGCDAWLFAGCGIVAGSDPAAEYAETLLKLRPMEDALTSAGGEVP